MAAGASSPGAWAGLAAVAAAAAGVGERAIAACGARRALRMVGGGDDSAGGAEAAAAAVARRREWDSREPAICTDIEPLVWDTEEEYDAIVEAEIESGNAPRMDGHSSGTADAPLAQLAAPPEPAPDETRSVHRFERFEAAPDARQWEGAQPVDVMRRALKFYARGAHPTPNVYTPTGRLRVGAANGAMARCEKFVGRETQSGPDRIGARKPETAHAQDLVWVCLQRHGMTAAAEALLAALQEPGQPAQADGEEVCAHPIRTRAHADTPLARAQHQHPPHCRCTRTWQQRAHEPPLPEARTQSTRTHTRHGRPGEQAWHQQRGARRYRTQQRGRADHESTARPRQRAAQRSKARQQVRAAQRSKHGSEHAPLRGAKQGSEDAPLRVAETSMAAEARRSGGWRGAQQRQHAAQEASTAATARRSRVGSGQRCRSIVRRGAGTHAEPEGHLPPLSAPSPP